ncbi:MAG: squalene/phytoene synthase family protein [Steroidobacteraceae bacterium]
MNASLPGPAAPPPAGSLHWNAWLFTPRPLQPLTAALFALEAELRAIVAANVDHGVSHLKLQWWKEEIDRLGRGAPRHPLTQALWRARPEATAAWRPLLDALSSLEFDLAKASYETEAELDGYLRRADGFCRTAAIALCPAGDAEPLERLARAAGQSVRLVEIIRDLRQDAIDGCIYLPLDWLGENGISHVELRDADVRVGTRRCLERLAARSAAQWKQAMTQLDAVDLPELRGLRVLGALHDALLARIEHEGFAVGRRRITLAPLAGLWTAWRVARQH